MNITKATITVRDLFEDYENNEEGGVTAYGGRLNIRPAYQREFVYNRKQQEAVIQTVLSGFPLNTMYWSKNSDDSYEVIDGQQRSISICEFCDGEFSITNRVNSDERITACTLENNGDERFETLMDYELDVYICEGTEAEKLAWYQVINTYGEKLNQQELLNAVYTGAWLADARAKFSKTNCPAVRIQGSSTPYVSGSSIRQDILATAIKWASGAKKECDETCAAYMAAHQQDEDASELFNYFLSVINWVKTTFPVYYKEMKSINWGSLYDDYHENEYDAEELNERIKALYADEDVTSAKGIWPYVLDGNERHLSIRPFTPVQKQRKYNEQNGCCARCHESKPLAQMQGDHIVPWSEGGKTVYSNLQMLCRKCNNEKSNL